MGVKDLVEFWGKGSRKVFDLEMTGGYAGVHEPGS